MGKRIQGFLFLAIFRIMGILVLVLGIRMVGEGIFNYIAEWHQQDWVPAAAWVTMPTSRCTAGLLLGGAKAVHLMELCMGTWQGEKMGKPGDFA